MELEKTFIRPKIKLTCPKCGESWEADKFHYLFMPFFRRDKDTSLTCPKCSTMGRSVQ